MKKAGIFFIAILATGFVFGQNTSTVTQTGLANNASVSQTGSNSAIVFQEALTGAKNNKAVVLQNGAGNKVNARQHQQAGITASQNVNVKQIGDNNTATQLQGFGYTGYNSAIINQLSSGNTGYQRQDGYNLGATIAQSMGNGNIGTQNQSGSYLNATITQKGGSNVGTQSQSAMNSSASIVSDGSRNTASQTQSGGTYNDPPRYLSGHKAFISQNGSDNFAQQSQSGTENNYTSIIQDGDFNSSVQSVNGSSNTSKLYQTSGGVSVINQTGNLNVIKGLGLVGIYDASWAKFSGSKLDVVQIGTKNSLSLEANGIVDVIQNNSVGLLGDKIEFSQAGGGTSVLKQTGGDANLVKLIKTGGGSADITQTGNTNKVAQFDDVFGAANATGAALFNGADLDVTQIGTSNLLNLNSTNAGAIVDVMQNGMANKASISQQP